MGVRLTVSAYYFKFSVLTSTNPSVVSRGKYTKFRMVGTHS